MEQNTEKIKISFFRETRGKIVFAAALLVLLLVLMFFSWTVQLELPPISQLLFPKAGEGDGMLRKILMQIRLPRIILGALTGACLAVSGAILQGVMRNPLASPGIIGVSSGGGLCGLIVLLFFPQYLNLQLPASFAGAMAAALIIYGLAWKRGTDPVRLVLAGVAVSSMLGAVSGILMMLSAEETGRILDFTFGSLAAAGEEDVFRVLPYMIIGLLSAFYSAGKINVLALGDDTATSLGLCVERTRFLLIITAALLAAAAVSAAGLIGFVGLIAPHMIRMISGPDNHYLLPVSGAFGAILVVGCDFAGRMIASPGEFPVGLLLALLGPPFFLWLLRRSRYEV